MHTYTCMQLLKLSVPQKNSQIKMYKLMAKMELKFHLCFGMSIVLCIFLVYLISIMCYTSISEVRVSKFTGIFRFSGNFIIYIILTRRI